MQAQGRPPQADRTHELPIMALLNAAATACRGIEERLEALRMHTRDTRLPEYFGRVPRLGNKLPLYIGELRGRFKQLAESFPGSTFIAIPPRKGGQHNIDSMLANLSLSAKALGSKLERIPKVDVNDVESSFRRTKTYFYAGLALDIAHDMRIDIQDIRDITRLKVKRSPSHLQMLNIPSLNPYQKYPELQQKKAVEDVQRVLQEARVSVDVLLTQTRSELKPPKQSRVDAALREFDETARRIQNGIRDRSVDELSINDWLQELRKILRRCIRPYVSAGYFDVDCICVLHGVIELVREAALDDNGDSDCESVSELEDVRSESSDEDRD
ncbi:hypothetical protein BDN72DRAFT_898005 [Pluteus cervinus]|uniref:Uncharacterized protein n=1 Tax=Pluteus cervinus TaxID=181527 RepID=A0ACD3ASR3_9AGAR|nr:hypothetical protein BDN72DRAFT_898005 [Pluteus cervinus]